jgi:hypothetical protein
MSVPVPPNRPADSDQAAREHGGTVLAPGLKNGPAALVVAALAIFWAFGTAWRVKAFVGHLKAGPAGRHPGPRERARSLAEAFLWMPLALCRAMQPSAAAGDVQAATALPGAPADREPAPRQDDAGQETRAGNWTSCASPVTDAPEATAITDAFRNPEPAGNGYAADRGGETLLTLPVAGSRDGDAEERGPEPLLLLPVAGSRAGDAEEYGPEPLPLLPVAGSRAGVAGERGTEPLLIMPGAGARDGDAEEYGPEPLLLLHMAGSWDGEAVEHCPDPLPLRPGAGSRDGDAGEGGTEPLLIMPGAGSRAGDAEERGPEPLQIIHGAGSCYGDDGEHGTEQFLLMPGAGSRDGDAGERGSEALLLMPGAGSRDGDAGERGPEPLLIMPGVGSRDGDAVEVGPEPLRPGAGSRDGDAVERGTEALLLMPGAGSRDWDAGERGTEPFLLMPGAGAGSREGDAGERATEPFLLMPGAGSRDGDAGERGSEALLLMPGAGTLADGQQNVPQSRAVQGYEDGPECLVASPGCHKGATFFGHVVESADGRHALAVTDASGMPVGAAWTGQNARLTSRGVRQASVRLRELSGAARIILVGSPGRARRRGGIRLVHVQKRFAGLDDRLWKMLGTDGVAERLAAGDALDVAGSGEGGLRELVIQRPGFGEERRLDFAEALADTARLVNGSCGARPVGMRTASLQTAAATGWKGIERYFMKESPRDRTSKWALIPETVERFRAVLGLCAFTTTVPAPTLPAALAGAAVARHLELRERAAEIGGDLRALVRGLRDGDTGSSQESSAFLADPDAWKDFTLAASRSPAANGTRKGGTSGGIVPASAATLLDGIRKGPISAALDSLKDFASDGIVTATARSLTAGICKGPISAALDSLKDFATMGIFTAAACAQDDGIRKKSFNAATTSSQEADYRKGTVPAALGSPKGGIGAADDVPENSVRKGAVTHEVREIMPELAATKKPRAEGKAPARLPDSAAKGKPMKRKSSPARKRSAAGKSTAPKQPSPKGSSRSKPAMTGKS